MATSGTTTASLTVRQVVTLALEELGVLPVGETPTGEDAAKAMQALGLMLKTWQVDGTGLQWQWGEITFTWTGAATSVTLNTNYLDIRNLRRRASSIDTPLARISMDDYGDIPNKSQAGTPTLYSVLKTRSTLELRIWPVPPTNTTMYAEGLAVIEDVTSLDQDLDVPQEWLETVAICLAARLLKTYRVHLTDPAGAQDIRERAAMFYARLSNFDEERESTFFGAA